MCNMCNMCNMCDMCNMPYHTIQVLEQALAMGMTVTAGVSHPSLNLCLLPAQVRDPSKVTKSSHSNLTITKCDVFDQQVRKHIETYVNSSIFWSPDM